MAGESRQGQVPDGWSKQGVVVPDAVWRDLRSLATARGHGSMKVLGTAGLGIAAGMPEHIRTRLAKWIIQADYDGASHVTPQAIYQEFITALREDLGNAVPIGPVVPIAPPGGEPITHKVVRIVGPEAKPNKGAA